MGCFYENRSRQINVTSGHFNASIHYVSVTKELFYFHFSYLLYGQYSRNGTTPDYDNNIYPYDHAMSRDHMMSYSTSQSRTNLHSTGLLYHHCNENSSYYGNSTPPNNEKLKQPDLRAQAESLRVGDPLGTHKRMSSEYSPYMLAGNYASSRA